MMARARRLLSILLATLLLAYSASNPAAEPGVDIVFVLDSSGSMKQSDRERLRIQAAKMFIQLLDKNDRAALVSFSGKAYAITGLLPLKQASNEQKLLKAVDKISDKGAFTNIYQALEKARELLVRHKSPGRKQHIILMSDGKMDVGRQERNLTLTERTLEAIAPRLARDRIKVHTISFARSSNIPLMKLIAEDTRGVFTLLQGPEDIHQVFEHIFQRAKRPDMLPVNEDSFVVDEAVKEITVLATKYRPDSRIILETPDGDTLSARRHGPSVRWYQARQFDLITLRNPASGYWLIKYSESGNKAYIVTDLKLQVETVPEVPVNSPFLVQAWLEKDGKRIKRGPLIQSTGFLLKLKPPRGRSKEYSLEDTGLYGDERALDGYHSLELKLDKPGEYRLDITAVGETFDRQKTVYVTVKQPEPEINPFALMDAPQPPPLENPGQAPQAPPVVPTPAPVAPPAPSLEHTAPAAHEPAADTHSTPEQENHDTETDHEEAEPEEQESHWLGGLLIFLLLNVIVGASVGAYFVIKKYRKANKKKDEEENQEQEKAG